MTNFEIKARMFAALSATNEAILKARSAQELCQQVCEAGVGGGGFRSAGALFPDENGTLKFTAKPPDGLDPQAVFGFLKVRR